MLRPTICVNDRKNDGNTAHRALVDNVPDHSGSEAFSLVLRKYLQFMHVDELWRGLESQRAGGSAAGFDNCLPLPGNDFSAVFGAGIVICLGCPYHVGTNP